ncbi:MAG: hypothetical protein V3U24_08195 [Candidatus Neomarinimicrobiota bacterium]
MKWFKHAFAVDSPGPAVPTDPERGTVDRVCEEIVRRHLATPSLLFLEMFRPLNYLGSQVLHFFQPFVTTVLDPRGYRNFTEFLEKRGSVDYLCGRIEALEELHSEREKKASAEKVS